MQPYRKDTIINEIKWQGNPVLSTLRPMLEAQSEEAEQFRAEIGLLHHRLERHEIPTGKGNAKQRISLTQVFLKDRPPTVKAETLRGIAFKVERLANGQMKYEVRSKSGRIILQASQTEYDELALQADSPFRTLSVIQRGVLMQLYKEAAPRWLEDLTQYEDPSAGLTPSGKSKAKEIVCGAYAFRCGKDVLYAGLIEVIYSMRCTLFHGELVPTREASACYEPAFRIVRRFLEYV